MEAIQAVIDEESLFASTRYDEEQKIVFSPPAYEQRYRRVANLLGKFSIHMKHIVEFGVAEMKSFMLFRNTLNKLKIFDLVDIDGELLYTFKDRVNPLVADFLAKREEELTVRVWRGSVAEFNPNFVDVDAVIAIELIEHVFPDVLEEIPYVIFNQIHPKIVCITTPNCEFNQLLDDLPDGKFRHYDHKFEWSRQQFQDWAENICTRFPEYSVIFTGIGKPPPSNFEHLGTLSQMAVFIRKDFLIQTEEDEIQEEKIGDLEDQDQEGQENIKEDMKECPGYEIVHTVTYPFFKDKRSHEQKLIEEIAYAVGNLRYHDSYFNDEEERIEIPLSHIVDSCYKISEDYDEIKRTIVSQQNYCLDGELLILKSEDDQNEEMSESEKDDE